MAESLQIAEGSKTEQYEALVPQIASLIEGENDERCLRNSLERSSHDSCPRCRNIPRTHCMQFGLPFGNSRPPVSPGRSLCRIGYRQRTLEYI